MNKPVWAHILQGYAKCLDQVLHSPQVCHPPRLFQIAVSNNLPTPFTGNPEPWKGICGALAAKRLPQAHSLWDRSLPNKSPLRSLAQDS